MLFCKIGPQVSAKLIRRWIHLVLQAEYAELEEQDQDLVTCCVADVVMPSSGSLALSLATAHSLGAVGWIVRNVVITNG